MSSPIARRIAVTITDITTAPGLREAARDQARQSGVRGWVRLAEESEPAQRHQVDGGSARRHPADGSSARSGLALHAEGAPEAVQDLLAWLSAQPGVTEVRADPGRVEGHEQFAVRGMPAGVFVVQEHQATAHHFDLRLQVGDVMRSWAVPKGPSLDPAVKRFAVQVEDHSLGHNDFEGRSGGGGVIVWDRGVYEQGGRVSWPEALERGHAVFVLHGSKLSGGFALQRTRRGDKPQWLLIKRRDAHARPGSDITAERPESLVSGLTLTQLLSG